MTRSEAFAKLTAHAGAIRAMGATSLYLYGSTAKNAATTGSDLDLFIEYDPALRFNAFDLVGIKLLREERSGLPVYLTTRDSLHPLLRDRIEAQAVRIF